MRKLASADGWRPARATRHSVRLLMLVALGASVAFTRVMVAGDSMRPTLEPGDRLLVLRVGHRRGLRLGELVTVRDPREAGAHRVLVKRVAALDAQGAAVEGDNPEESTDSRTFGRVPLRSVTGKILYRYSPPARAGVVR